MSTDRLVSRLRQPEYTGENRCIPCTVVNAAIAVVLAVALGGAVGSATDPASGLVVGLAVLCLSGAAIYLRGYLVPGTPTLTKRYFPSWLLDAFGKTPAQDGDAGAARTTQDGIDPEAELTAVGAIEECRDGSDLCLTAAFREEWEGAVERVRERDADRAELLALLGVEGAVEYEEYGGAFRALVDDRVVGKWESRAAFLADLGAASVLERRHPDWEQFGTIQRGQLLNGLRLFVETCPSCGGRPDFGTDTVESCCSTHEVAAVSCSDCGARLFESQPL